MPPVDLFQFFRPATLRDALHNESQSRMNLSARGCWVSTRPTTPEGYARVSLKMDLGANQGKYKTVYVHRLAFFAHTGANHGPDEQMSHLCDNPTCFNPQHLAAETGQVNRTRSFCVGILLCPWHMTQITNLCSHTPTCLKPLMAREDFNCCLQDAPESSQHPARSQSIALRDSLTGDGSSQVAEGPLEETGEDPRSGAIIVISSSPAPVIRSSPPGVAGTKRPASEGDDDSQSLPRQPSPRRARVADTFSSSSDRLRTIPQPPPSDAEN